MFFLSYCRLSSIDPFGKGQWYIIFNNYIDAFALTIFLLFQLNNFESKN